MNTMPWLHRTSRRPKPVVDRSRVRPWAGTEKVNAAATAMLMMVLAAALFAAPAFSQPASNAGARSPAPGSEPSPSLYPVSGPLVLTLDQALAIAAEKNRDIQKALEYQKWVQGKYVEERAGAFPHLTINANLARNHDESQKKFYKEIPPEFASGLFSIQQDVRGAEIGLSQALYTWGQVGAAIRGAKAGIASAADQLRLYRQATARDVTAGFYDVVLAKEMAAIAAQNLELKQRHLDEATRKQFAGTATDYDVLAAEVAVENARPDAIRTGNLVLVARDKLRFLLAEEREVDVTGELHVAVGTEPDYDQALACALEHRPDLNDIGHRKTMFAELVKIQAAYDKPRLDLRAGYGYRAFRVSNLTTAGKTWYAGVYLSFPFFDGLKTRGQVAEAKSDLATANIEEAKLHDGVALEVRTAVNAVRESGEIVEALSGTVAQAERLLFMAEEGYKYGVKTHLDAQDAQLNLLSAKGNLARAERDYRVAQVTLEWVMGTLGEAGQA